MVPDMTGARSDSAISLVRFDPAKEIQVLRVRHTSDLNFYDLYRSTTLPIHFIPSRHFFACSERYCFLRVDTTIC